MGENKRGGNELTLPENGLTLNLSSLWPLGQIKNGATQGVLNAKGQDSHGEEDPKARTREAKAREAKAWYP